MDGFGNGPVLAAPAASVTTQAVGSALVPQLETAPLPAGLPSQLNHPLAWTSSNFQDNSTYTHVVDADGLAELRAAVASFKTRNQDGNKVDCNNFPLPRLGGILSKLSQDVHNGRGFCVIRGVNPADFSVGDLTLVYLGVQAYIANERGRQDSKGNMLVHIVADNSATRTEHHRHSTKSITFHNEEGCDVVSWLTRSTAASGGKCIISSAYTVYNVLAATRPDLVRVLARSDWPFAMPHFQCRPIIFYRNSKLIMNFGRAPLLGNAAHPRPGHYPKITQHQLEALDAVEAIAQASQLEIKTQAGDMHFINNLAILHRREGFIDGAGQAEKRHLVRMWLRSSELGWAIPEELKREWSEAFKKEGRRVYHVEPMPERFFPLRIHPN